MQEVTGNEGTEMESCKKKKMVKIRLEGNVENLREGESERSRDQELFVKPN